MTVSKTTKGIFIALVFITSLLSRIPLVDSCYQHSFEPDSYGCIENTISFYFFFRNPVKENAPHPLSSYPTYFAGHYITSSLLAIAVRPVAKNTNLLPNLSDGDKSLIIFSMRWSSVLFDALTNVFVFLTMWSVSSSLVMALLVWLLFFLLNIPLLQVDLIRVDHYALFAYAFLIWAAYNLYLFPKKWSSYVLSGISFALAAATKINFLLYTLPLFLIFAILISRKQISVKNIFFFILPLSATLVFFFQRWLYYPENVIPTLSEIIKVGEDWFIYWGNANYKFYHWDQFFSTQQFTLTVILIIVMHVSFLYVFIRAIQQKNSGQIALCVAFMVQSLSLALAPKVDRYGIIIPVWLSIFFCIALSQMPGMIQNRSLRVILTVALLGPFLIYSYSGYSQALHKSNNRKISIEQTRIAAANWVNENVQPGSCIGIQPPYVSNPPIFTQPYVVNDVLLRSRFLNKEEFCGDEPPKFQELKATLNYLILNDKETNHYLQTLQQHNCDSALAWRWKKFFESLPVNFPEICFCSNYENYGVKCFHIYKISENHGDSRIISNIRTQTVQDSANSWKLRWSYYFDLGENPDRFQIQIAEDSLMQWLVYGCRRGYPSKYRTLTKPRQILNDKPLSFIPNKVAEALNEGVFSRMLGRSNPYGTSVKIETLFSSIFREMAVNNLTFEESVKKTIRGEQHAAEFIKLVRSLYLPEHDIAKLKAEEYNKVAELNIINLQDFLEDDFYSMWEFRVPIPLDPEKCYYWRVRAREQNNILSEWSPVAKTSRQTKELLATHNDKP